MPRLTGAIKGSFDVCNKRMGRHILRLGVQQIGSRSEQIWWRSGHFLRVTFNLALKSSINLSFWEFKVFLCNTIWQKSILTIEHYNHMKIVTSQFIQCLVNKKRRENGLLKQSFRPWWPTQWEGKENSHKEFSLVKKVLKHPRTFLYPSNYITTMWNNRPVCPITLLCQRMEWCYGQFSHRILMCFFGGHGHHQTLFNGSWASFHYHITYTFLMGRWSSG